MTHAQSKGNNREEPCSKLELSDKHKQRWRFSNSKSKTFCKIPSFQVLASFQQILPYEVIFFCLCYETIAWPRGALRPSPVWSACKNNQKTFQLKYDILFNRNKADFHTAEKITEVLVR